MNRRHVLSLLAMSAALASCKDSTPSFNAIDLTGAKYARDFRLPDTDGKMRSLGEFKGKVVAMFFGYTQCPDVCPTTMAELAEAKKLLGADGDKLQVVFVTIDPERDKPSVLKAYMANFDPTFVGLVPTQEQLAQVAGEYKVYYKKADGPTPTSYTMDHSAATYIYDTQGQLRLYTRYGGGAQVLVSDIKKLLAV
jgi:protein SCO1/2